MKNQNYACAINTNVTAEKAMEGISRVSEWWARNYNGKSEKVNDTFVVRFGDTMVAFKITEIVPGKKVVWHVTDCHLHWQNDKTEWKDTDVVFEISEKNDSTQINFTHIGLVPEVECYESCIRGWDQYVKGSLPKLLTEGKGLPN